MSENSQEVLITANEAAHRFETGTADKKSFLQYYLSDNSIVFTHTEVPKSLESHGIGSQLARAGLDYARREGLIVVPLCPFIEDYLRKHPRDLELVDASYRSRFAH